MDPKKEAKKADRKTRVRLTLQRIAKAPLPEGRNQSFLFDTESPRLAVRVTQAGARSFIFEAKLHRQTIRTTIGSCYVWSLEDARKEANRLKILVDQGIDPREVEREKRIRKVAERTEKEIASKYTLEALLNLYVGSLIQNGKGRAAGNAKSAFAVHVPEDLLGLPARDIVRPQITEIIRRVRESGKDRTAGVLRAYLHAAYERAMTAETDSSVPAGFIAFRIETNPVRGVKTIPVNAGDRVLTREELSLYLEAMDGRPADVALRVALLSGGQRMEQLLRAGQADWDPDEQILVLWDRKGKRTAPRKHILPLSQQAAALVDLQAKRARAAKKEFLFFSDRVQRMDPGTPGKRLKAIAAKMEVEPFDLRDVRRTCETHLADIGITKDIRAQLLSHGLGGVQAKHYDRHKYLTEKRSALRRWEAFLQSGEGAPKVVDIASRRKGRS